MIQHSMPKFDFRYLKLYLLPVLLLLPTVVHGQETKTHPIDKYLNTCTEKDPSTAGMVQCTDTAYKMWDKELNKNYLALMRKLKPEGKQSLKAAQLEWIKYRDTEFKLIDSIYDMFEGTMYIPMRAGQRMDLIKARAQELASFLDLVVNESAP